MNSKNMNMNQTNNNGIEEDKLITIFHACDATRSGDLDLHELKLALRAFGLYTEKETIEKKILALELKPPLKIEGFSKLLKSVEDTNEPEVKRGPFIIPHSRRGMSLEQLEDVLSAIYTKKWMPKLCKKLNDDQKPNIFEKLNKMLGKEKPKQATFKNSVNMYTIDKEFVQPVTSCKATRRHSIPKAVLKAAKLPDTPSSDCSFSELANPEGVDIDYFVSHAWLHDYQKTVKALVNFAKSVYQDIGKKSPKDVTFWVCTFALNQHKAKDEVGDSPEQGPFNAALAHAKHGAVMVLDSSAHPMQRIWCLFEIGRAKELRQPFEMVVDEGKLDGADIETLGEIGNALVRVRAGNAESSDEEDKIKIHYHILDAVQKRSMKTLEHYRIHVDVYGVKEYMFRDFDVHICGLIGTPLMKAGLTRQSAEVCFQALGMGAEVTMDELQKMVSMGSNINDRVNSRFGGKCSLAHVFAYQGLNEQLKYVLQGGVDVNEKDGFRGTPLHRAAQRGHLDICRLLLGEGAEIGNKNNAGSTALHYAAMFGHSKICSLLLNHRWMVDDKTNIGETPLNLAAKGGCEDVCGILLDYGANIESMEKDGSTPLISAADSGQVGICELLLQRGAVVNGKTNEKATALWFGAQNGHIEVCNLLLDNGAAVDEKNNDGNTSLVMASQDGHFDVCELLLKNRANVSIENNKGDTPLMVAAINGHFDVCKLLLKNGANIHTKNKRGMTPLHLAAYKGHTRTCSLLIDHGADVAENKNDWNETALQMAEMKGHTEVCTLLRNRGP